MRRASAGVMSRVPICTPASSQRRPWISDDRISTPSTAPDSDPMPPTTSMESVVKVRPR